MWLLLNTVFVASSVTVLGALRCYKTADVLIRFWAESFLWVFGMRCAVRGMERANGIGACVILSTHRSNLDAPCLIGRLPMVFSFVIKRALLRVPIFGWGVQAARYVSIDRADRADALSGMARACDLLKTGRSVLVFPEGTRSPTEDMLPLKKGGIVLAIQAQVPILPVAVAGTRSLMPKKHLMIHSGRAVLNVGEPIQTTGLTYEDRDQVLQRVQAAMSELYAQANSDASEVIGESRVAD